MKIAVNILEEGQCVSLPSRGGRSLAVGLGLDANDYEPSSEGIVLFESIMQQEAGCPDISGIALTFS